jgi:hypothetical protein
VVRLPEKKKIDTESEFRTSRRRLSHISSGRTWNPVVCTWYRYTDKLSAFSAPFMEQKVPVNLPRLLLASTWERSRAASQLWVMLVFHKSNKHFSLLINIRTRLSIASKLDLAGTRGMSHSTVLERNSLCNRCTMVVIILLPIQVINIGMVQNVWRKWRSYKDKSPRIDQVFLMLFSFIVVFPGFALLR